MSKPLYQGRFLCLKSRNNWEYCERTRSNGVVCIIPITNDHQLILVEQYREPLQGRVIELPAGLVGDEPGTELENKQTAAERELEEETGYQAKNWSAVHHGPSSAGLSSETVQFFLATELNQTGPGGGCDGEDIIVHSVGLDQIHKWLDQKIYDEYWVDPKVYAGLYWIHQYQRQ